LRQASFEAAAGRWLRVRRNVRPESRSSSSTRREQTGRDQKLMRTDEHDAVQQLLRRSKQLRRAAAKLLRRIGQRQRTLRSQPLRRSSSEIVHRSDEGARNGGALGAGKNLAGRRRHELSRSELHCRGRYKVRDHARHEEGGRTGVAGMIWRRHSRASCRFGTERERRHTTAAPRHAQGEFSRWDSRQDRQRPRGRRCLLGGATGRKHQSCGAARFVPSGNAGAPTARRTGPPRDEPQHPSSFGVGSCKRPPKRVAPSKRRARNSLARALPAVHASGSHAVAAMARAVASSLLSALQLEDRRAHRVIR